MSNHTPGPWRSEETGDGMERLIVGWIGESPGPVTCVAVVSGNATSQEGTEANARLIAAAPDLLAACKAALATHGPHAGCSLTTLLHDAIAKAEGRAP